MTNLEAPRYTPVKKQVFYLKDADNFKKELDTSKADPTKEEKPPVVDTPVKNPESDEKTVDWAKRYSDLKSHVDKEKNSITSTLTAKEQEILTLREQLADATKAKELPITVDQLNVWKEQFPEFAETMRTLIALETKPVRDDLEKKVSKVEADQKALAADKGWAELLKIHPDAEELKTDLKFAEWYNEQEPEIKALIDSPVVSKIARGLTLFKKDTGVKTKKELDKDTSVAITTSSKPALPKEDATWSNSKVKAIPARDFPKYAAEIDKARKEGRFIYD